MNEKCNLCRTEIPTIRTIIETDPEDEFRTFYPGLLLCRECRDRLRLTGILLPDGIHATRKELIDYLKRRRGE